eukprot:gnl/MRDRNA2_/MRDRNA2_167847_c0_seq1.p1 gnl/MRDRNA2_/MRDRNA2_167847_c0~~gnl/MRDRNA2_/MRDRNA2_167847_c0_seq1.p1  ORF type:complete len:442 (+),score=50.87 gnl/MRDRNA2_/MRDRNA2_167847_c0_seq1:120-1328(+)
MEGAARQPKRPRCDTASSPTLDSLLEERVRMLVARELSWHHTSSDGDQRPAVIGPCSCSQELVQCKQELEKLRKEFESMKKSMQDLQKTVNDLKPPSVETSAVSTSVKELKGSLTLKIGARKFPTTADTLRAFPDSFFGLMAAGRVPQKFEKDGSIFIDRNPKHFSFVLDYLRSMGEGFTPPNSCSAQDELSAEADFYGLPGLVALLRRLRVASHHLMTLGKKGTVLTGNKFSGAILDVPDTTNFSVTVGLSKYSTTGFSAPFWIGVAPLHTDLSEPWLTEGRVMYPPAAKHGLFLTLESRVAITATAATGSFQQTKHSDVPHYGYSDTIESVQVCFHRNEEYCIVSFRLVIKYGVCYNGRSTGAFQCEIRLADLGLPFEGDYRPITFLADSATLTIQNMTA